jgi:ClpP class serine protease
MAARQLPGQLQTSAVPQARLEEWYNFKQEQDNTRAEFEQRVAEARRKLLERHANEQQAFWTGQPCAAWQPVANGQTATLPSQVNATSSGPQRVVGQPAVSGSRGPAQNSVPTTLGQPKAPAHAPKRNPAVNHGALDQPNVPANAPKKGAKAVPPAATRDAGMARSQVCNPLAASKYSP